MSDNRDKNENESKIQIKRNEELVIKLKQIKNVKDISYMFAG